MAFSEFEKHRIEKIVGAFIEVRRPPPHLRDQVDLAYRIEQQSVVLLETRRVMDGSYVERPFAKATWVKTRKHWRVYWQRADLRWHGYEPLAETPTIEAFVQEVESDPYACFFG